MRLRQLVNRIGSSKDSRLIVALDLIRDIREFNWIRNFIAESSEYVVGYKIGVPMMLSYGLENIKLLIDSSDDDLIWIADMKLADIGYVGRLVIDLIYKTGFDAIIMHTFIGYKGGAGESIEYSKDIGLSPIAVAAMSHPGAEEYLNPVSKSLLIKSLDYPVEGYILPATFTKYISEYRELVGDRVILSPGVGVQGAPPSSAVAAGADIEIIGRLIYMDEEPISRVREIHGVLRWRRRE